jgi:hypothetical protein
MNNRLTIEDWLNSNIENEKPKIELDKTPFELLNICTKDYSKVFWAAKVARPGSVVTTTTGSST